MHEIPRFLNLGAVLGYLEISVFFKGAVAMHVSVSINSLRREPSSKKDPFVLKISSQQMRCQPGILPEEIKWVPADLRPSPREMSLSGDRWILVSDEDSEGIPNVFFLESEGRLMPALPKVTWHERDRRGSQDATVEQCREIGRELLSFFQVVESEISSLKEIDLDKDYPSGSVLEHIRKLVLSSTVPISEYPFKPATGELSSEEIQKKLNPHWKSFVSGPWRRSMTGHLANLKYYCENGELPRFYSLDLENSFGFRLRTRDHSWIVGKVFLSSGWRDDGDTTHLRLVSRFRDNYGSEVVSFGSMNLLIAGEERTDRH
jgi:hypothetical protein